MKAYLLKVSIFGVPRVSRLLEVSGNSTFSDLHDAIFDAFHRYDPHLYSFFLTGKDTKNVRSIFQAPEITHPQNTEDFMGFGPRKKSAASTRLKDIGFAAKDVFHYLFDFGDDWWHRYTKGLDVWIERSSENAERLLNALKGFGFGSLDITSLQGLDFGDCYPKSVRIEIQNVQVNFIDVENLKINKKATGRPQDLADLANLESD